MDTVKTLEKHRTQATTTYVSFEVDDNKGREIGAYLHTYEIEFFDAPEATCYYRIPAGQYFAFKPQAARARESYGACQSSQYFATRQERNLYMDKYLASARKRAQKHNA